MGDEMRMDAYYYGFESVGVLSVDKILSAVASAGKAYHHTEEWTSESEYLVTPDHLRGVTCADWIQNAAADAAKEIDDLKAHLSAANERATAAEALAKRNFEYGANSDAVGVLLERERDAALARAAAMERERDTEAQRANEQYNRAENEKQRAARAERALDEERAASATFKRALVSAQQCVGVVALMEDTMPVAAKKAAHWFQENEVLLAATDPGRSLLDDRDGLRALMRRAKAVLPEALKWMLAETVLLKDAEPFECVESELMRLIADIDRALATAPGSVNTCACGSKACRCLNAGCGGFMNSRAAGACACETPTPACATAPGSTAFEQEDTDAEEY